VRIRPFAAANGRPVAAQAPGPTAASVEQAAKQLLFSMSQAETDGNGAGSRETSGIREPVSLYGVTEVAPKVTPDDETRLGGPPAGFGGKHMTGRYETYVGWRPKRWPSRLSSSVVHGLCRSTTGAALTRGGLPRFSSERIE